MSDALIDTSSDGNIDKEIMQDFFQDFREAHQHCEHVLIELEHRPTDKELLNTLFRSVHTIKGNLIYVRLKEISPLLQSVEDILEAMRDGKMLYEQSLSDLIILALSTTKLLVRARIENRPAPIPNDRFEKMCAAISDIVSASAEERLKYISQAIVIIDPTTKIGLEERKANRPENYVNTKDISQEQRILEKFGVEFNEDFVFFKGLTSPLESRSHFWLGRTERQLRIALAMNEMARRPLNPTQLAAAVYMHDVGMAFQPLEILHKSSRLTQAEMRSVQSHTKFGYDLLNRMQHWDEAAQMVLQHHERPDGAGYPKKLTSLEICDGAKILAIVDTFEARTHERAYSSEMKRPFIRAVLEINSCAGAQFSERWVTIFNDVIKRIHRRSESNLA